MKEKFEIFCYVCENQTKYSRWSEFKRYHLNVYHKDENYTEQEYYDKFFKKEKSEGSCKICNSLTRFNGFFEGYSTYCSAKCINSDESIKAKMGERKKEYFQNLSEEDRIKRNNKLKKVWKNRSEKEVKKIVDNGKATKLERYGDENYNNPEQISKSWCNKTEEEKDIKRNKIKDAIKKRLENKNND